MLSGRSPGADEEVAVAAALEAALDAVAAAAAALDARESMAEEMETASRVGVQAESGTEGVALTSFILLQQGLCLNLSDVVLSVTTRFIFV